MSLEQWTTFLGWATIWHFGFLLIIFLSVLPLMNWASEIHARWFNIEPRHARVMIYWFMGLYELGAILFFLIPYLVLRIHF